MSVSSTTSPALSYTTSWSSHPNLSSTTSLGNAFLLVLMPAHHPPPRWSGITEASLATATTTLAEVQTQLLTIIAPQGAPTSILVGHSLESDLKALRICHPLCIDTALIYHHPRGRPLKPGLAWLTKKWCNREIQTRGEGGHDPEEDARACVDLLRLKVQNGSGFGEFKTDQESIFERMSRACGRGGQGTVRAAVVDHGNPGVMHGSKATTAIGCGSDREVLDGLIQAAPAHEFLFGRFTGIADTLGCECALPVRVYGV